MPKTKRNKKQYGGEFLGEGAFGAVYGNPRLKCKRDTNTDDINNTVSKIFNFNYNHEALKEFNVLTRLKQFMNPEDLRLLQEKYSLLPIKRCNVYAESLKTHPYNTEVWKTGTKDNKVVRSNQFFKYVNPQKSEEIENLVEVEELAKLASAKSASAKSAKSASAKSSKLVKSAESAESAENRASLVIYKKGGDNLSTAFKKLQHAKNINEFYEVLIKLTNILEAIQILQKNNFIHGDIKPANCIVDKDGNYRLIDMADVEYIVSETYGGNNMPKSFMYFTWPATSIYSIFFNSKYFTNLQIPLKYNLRIFKNMFGSDLTFNINSFKWIHHYFLTFDSFKDIEFDGHKIDYYKDILVEQKTFGIKDVDVVDVSSDPKKKLLKPEFSNLDDQNIEKNLLNFNNFFENTDFKTRDELKLDLFKRCDIYSFGIIVLICTQNATGICKNSMIPKIKNLLTNLFKFVWICCHQDKKVVSIDDLVEFWKTNIISLITPKPFVIDSNKVDIGETSDIKTEGDVKSESDGETKSNVKSESDVKIDIDQIYIEEPASPSPEGCIGRACKIVSSVFTRRGGSKKRRRNKTTRR